MFFKVRAEEPNGWYVFECERIHYYEISWEEFANTNKPEEQHPSWDISISHHAKGLMDETVLGGKCQDISVILKRVAKNDVEALNTKLNALSFIRAILHTKEEKEIIVQFDSIAYLRDDTGRTIEKIVASDLS